jgi:low temperature requirement protein LtrA
LPPPSTEVLSYEPDHIAERYGLFTLIVLGESIVAVVAGLDTGSEARAVLVAVLGLVIASAIWWLYFDRFRGMPGGSVRTGFVWAQGHLLVFAGIAAAAVGIEFAIEAAAAHAELALAERLPLGAGLAAYLVPMAMIRAATRRPDWVAALRVAAAVVVLALSLAGGLGPLTFVTFTTAVVVAECVVDLLGSPPERLHRPRLPHELARRRQKSR